MKSFKLRLPAVRVFAFALTSSCMFGQTTVFDSNTYHQPGSVDESFPPLALKDRLGHDIYALNWPYTPSVVVQPDGKIVVSGCGFEARYECRRWNADGSPDEAFRPKFEYASEC